MALCHANIFQTRLFSPICRYVEYASFLLEQTDGLWGNTKTLCGVPGK